MTDPNEVIADFEQGTWSRVTVEKEAGVDNSHEGGWALKMPPPVQWHWSFDRDFYVQFNLTNKPPNRFHRFMMRWCFGIYTRLAD